MSKVKITINTKENSVKINDQEINDVITNLTVNVLPTKSPTVTLTLSPMALEINGESFSVKKKIVTTFLDETAIYECEEEV